MALSRNINNLQDVDIIAYLTALFNTYKTEQSVTCSFLNGMLKDVVSELQKKETYPAMLFIEPIEENYDYDPNSSRFQSTSIKMIVTAPINWSDWSTNEIHTNTLSGLKAIAFGFQKYLLNDKSIDSKKLQYRTKSYTHYRLALQDGNRKAIIFDKNSAVEINFNLEFTNKFKTCS